MMLLFIPWDILFTYLGVWSFNPSYISNLRVGNLPLGEILFFVTIPYSCVFTYECLNIYFPDKYPIKKPSYLITALILFSAVIYALYFDKLYTGYTALIALLVLVIQLYYLKKVNYLGNFYRAFIFLIIPMFIVDGVLTGQPIIQYNELEKTPLRLGSIPWEDFHYNLIMLYMVVAFYEFLKKKDINRKSETRD